MLVDFAVKNFRSFKDEQTISLLSSSDNETDNAFKVTNEVSLLKTSVILGHNGSGKSNLIKAFSFVKDFIMGGKENILDNVIPYAFDNELEDDSSIFSIGLFIEGAFYQYDFCVVDGKLTEERLYIYDSNNETKDIFYRENNILDLSSEFFDDRKNQTVIDNGLFLTTGTHPLFTSIVRWFKDSTTIIDLEYLSTEYSVSMLKDEAKKAKIINLLKDSDVNIEDLQKDHRNRIVSYRKHKNGTLIPLFFIDYESTGVVELFKLSGYVLDVLEKGGVMVIDDLDSHFNHMLLRYFTGLFYSEKTNPLNAQLIFTSHDIALLNYSRFSRDQFWFMENYDTKGSSLVALLEFKKRDQKQLNNQLCYTQGRYGAIPICNQLGYYND